MTTRSCKSCGKEFHPRPQNPNQLFCSKPECQRERKRLWQMAKLQSDPDYRENQRQSQKRWRDSHRDYWKQWRARHPEYVEDNRKRQAERNAKLRREGMAEPVDASLFAKMDASTERSPILSGTYRVVPVDCKDGRVNSGFLCQISYLVDLSSDCKQITL